MHFFSKKLLSLVFLFVTFLTPVFVTTSVSADQISDSDVCKMAIDAELREAAGCNTTKTKEEVLKTFTNTFLAVIGGASVVMVIIGGIQILLSSGNASNVKTGRLTITYAVVGLIIAILAYAIINLVLSYL